MTNEQMNADEVGHNNQPIEPTNERTTNEWTNEQTNEDEVGHNNQPNKQTSDEW